MSRNTFPEPQPESALYQFDSIHINEIYGLASHMEKIHKNQIDKPHDINIGPTFKCNRCASRKT